MPTSTSASPSPSPPTSTSASPASTSPATSPAPSTFTSVSAIEPSSPPWSPKRKRTFESLPGEIRNQIYSELIGDRTVHVVLEDHESSSKIVGYESEQPAQSTLEDWGPVYKDTESGEEESPSRKKFALDIFRASKTTHAEASAAFYKTNRFVFRNHRALYKFAERVPRYNRLPRRVAFHLQYHGMEDLATPWAAIRHASLYFKSLVQIHVSVGICPMLAKSIVDTKSMDTLMRPLETLSSANTTRFSVEVRETDDDNNSEGDRAPIKVEIERRLRDLIYKVRVGKFGLEGPPKKAAAKQVKRLSLCGR